MHFNGEDLIQSLHELDEHAMIRAEIRELTNRGMVILGNKYITDPSYLDELYDIMQKISEKTELLS